MTHYRASQAWRDELGELLGKSFKGSRIGADDDNATITFADNCVIADDYVYFNVQLNHDKLTSGEVRPHLHWFQGSANVPNWYLAYRWQSNGAAQTTAWTPAAYTTNVFAYVSGDLVQITRFPPISAPVGAGLSDILQFRLARDTGNVSGLFAGADPLTGDAAALMFDIHFRVSTVGSIEEYIK